MLFFSKKSTGTPEKLFAAFQYEVDASKEVNFNVADVMNSWTTQAGYPVVNVSFVDNVVEFRQARFMKRTPSKDKIKKSQSKKPVWYVPINYASQSNPDFGNTRKVEWLREGTTRIIENASKDWIIFNVQQTGKLRTIV